MAKAKAPQEVSDQSTAIVAEVVPRSESLVRFGSSPIRSPQELVKQATEVAEVLSQVILSQELFKIIQGRRYVLCEGWTTLGAMLGVVPVEEYCRPIEDGFEAKIQLIRASDGGQVGGASAECTNKERTWKDRDSYALRSMALTRATGKAFRLSFSWVMKLAGFEPTPAEEMMFESSGSKEAADAVAKRKLAEHAQSPKTHSVTIEFSLDSKFLWMAGDGCAKLGNFLRAAGTQGNDGVWTVPGGDSVEMLKAMDDLKIPYKEGRIYTRSCEATGKAPVATTAPPAQPAAAKPPQAKEAQKAAPNQPHNPMAAPPASIPEHKTVELVAGPLEHMNATRTNGGPLTTSKGAPYVTMIVGERKFFAFSNHEMSINGRDTKPLQKIITALKPGAFVAFTAHCDAKGYWNVDRVLQLGELEWDETTGLSVLRRGDIPGQAKLL